MAESALRQGEGQPAKILIVDDDDAFRAVLARILDNHGYPNREARSAAEARASLETDEDVVAVVSDLRMPGGSGIELLSYLAADFPDLAVVMATGVDDPGTAETAFDIGVDGYLIKPFSTNALLIALNSAIRRRRLEVARRVHLRGLEHAITRVRTLDAVLRRVQVDILDGDESEETIERLSRAVSLRDEETGRHIQRMSRYASMLAEQVGYESTEQVRLATALHDVGKIGVPDTILLKPGPLSPDEYTTMQRHAQIGYQLLAGATTDLLLTAAQIAVGHHEWWDGGGYPSGLRGDQVPEVARIAAVADVFDALTTHRVYRPALPVDEAVAIMTGLRGRQFEPRLLDAFFDVAAEASAIRAAFPDREDDETRIRVLLVDDHEIFLHSLVRLLSAQPAIKVVGTSRSVEESVEAAIAYEPDVILMDFELPDGDGVIATERINTMTPGAKVVMLTGRSDEEAWVAAIRAGCAGFVRKTEAPEALVESIRAAHEGESIVGAADLSRLLGRLGSTHRGRGNDLAPRELELLRLVAAGLSNKTIAQELTISVNTVRNHVQNILYKLDAHSRLEAVAVAVREGIIER